MSENCELNLFVDGKIGGVGFFQNSVVQPLLTGILHLFIFLIYLPLTYIQFNSVLLSVVAEL